MPLIEFWRSNPQVVSQLTIEQVVSNAGDGNLRDNSACCQELREYLSEVESEKLAKYVEHCLTHSFAKSGGVLQDLVNELGRRLDYKVTNGRYQGTVSNIGFDGIWTSPERHSLVVEVKTTDAYRISLDTIAGYREKLTAQREITAPSSILIVVGREDTGELEAQVRGSRHAWDIRLISIDALLKLVKLNERVEEAETGRKIRSVLIPMEYTKLDDMIEVMFVTAKDVETAAEADTSIPDESDEDVSRGSTHPKGTWQFTDSSIIQAKREAILAAVGRREGVTLLKKSRALHWSADRNVRVACSISKRYSKGAYKYWYAYHPRWDKFLGDAEKAFFALGCVDLDFAFAVPVPVLRGILDALNTTTTENGHYWHIYISEASDGAYRIVLPRQRSGLALNDFTVKL
ncbi:MAG TPA: hypothetical protein VGU20_00020 [Stellaceae bacterium]|nr:hypothetical protein [Stellaceae bacterium]